VFDSIKQKTDPVFREREKEKGRTQNPNYSDANLFFSFF